MPRLILCSSCNVHVRSAETVCPHCGQQVRSTASKLGAAASAVLMGLALAGCEKGGAGPTNPEPVPSDDGGVGEPEYGMPVTDDGDLPEPEYGVPATEDAEDAEADVE